MAKKKNKKKAVEVVERPIFPYNYILTDEGPMDGHKKMGVFCIPYSFCPCRPRITEWNALTRQRMYEHQHRIH